MHCSLPGFLACGWGTKPVVSSHRIVSLWPVFRIFREGCIESALSHLKRFAEEPPAKGAGRGTFRSSEWLHSPPYLVPFGKATSVGPVCTCSPRAASPRPSQYSIPCVHTASKRFGRDALQAHGVVRTADISKLLIFDRDRQLFLSLLCM